MLFTPISLSTNRQSEDFTSSEISMFHSTFFCQTITPLGKYLPCWHARYEEEEQLQQHPRLQAINMHQPVNRK